MEVLFCLGLLVTTGRPTSLAANDIPPPGTTSTRTRVSIAGGEWHINGTVTYAGAPLHGEVFPQP